MPWHLIFFIQLAAFLLLPDFCRADQPRFTWGGDLRARIVDFHRIPTEGGGLLPENRFLRFRSRLRGSYAFSPDLIFQARLVNEWREYDGEKGSNDYQAMDEFVVDNFFFDFNNLFNNLLDLRIGRQDMIYGTGKMIRTGTPLDSSRTFYFNAVRARLKQPNFQVDLIGIANDSEDEFAMHRENRMLFEGEETGGGVYVTNKRINDVTQEYYYLFKHEVRDANLDLHTWGARLAPRFNERFSANLEIALQDGRRDNGNDVDGHLLDISLYYLLPLPQSRRMVADLSYYYLSGDDPDTSREEGWHPLWSRFPQYMSYTIARSLMPSFAAWTNLSMPSIGLATEITDNLSLQLRLAKVYAPEEGLGGSKEKGTLFISRLTYTINANWDGKLHFEVMDPDSYYRAVTHYAHFAQIELTYHF